MSYTLTPPWGVDGYGTVLIWQASPLNPDTGHHAWHNGSINPHFRSKTIKKIITHISTVYCSIGRLFYVYFVDRDGHIKDRPVVIGDD
jgi:hypothetical protein